ncbi:2-amino-3-ketobutyrate coenzyme A ligase, mitochondrial-like [Homarus americanus]|uniref:2-amino-3-ketobutyrate coenzyme A ligase, mitochondrial n=1 Tax=Homarus americanus TaxID=6706 RepID=A0A8J5JUE2_HOMAM|nr:2-amino-3-ketobutyrate coenzyme A ligase, mitochondrial-like [Homarus americanus]KAG7164492.1 2-amino-3-ketobutyrate coenzyme A ligase-like [Homarus americanus]
MAALILRRGTCHLKNYCKGVRSSHAQALCRDVLGAELEGMKAAGTWKTERVITSKQAVKIRVQGQESVILNFCSNNYLGLSSHPEVIQAGKDALDKYGAGLSSVRFVCGTQDIHKELEKKIARFHGRDDAILFASCFDANAGLFEVLLTPSDAVLSDELNHASIIDGIRLCKARKFRYQHKNMQDLEIKLQECHDARMKLIVTDGVFSMDGNVAPLTKICDLADKYNAIVFVDECHATGFLGSSGRGTEEYFGLPVGRVDIINSTLGKALGGAAGGYTTGPQELISLLRQRARPYLFSNSLPPPVVASASKVFDLLLGNSGFAEKVQANTDRFRSQMREAGFTLAGENHPICPVMLGDARLALTFADHMLEKGIFVIGFSYPVVPTGKARIRVQISASHSFDDIDSTVEAFKQVGKNLGVIA